MAASAFLQAERGGYLNWVPVFLGLGIGLYFSLKVEPGIALLGGLGVTAIIAFALGHYWRHHWGPLLIGVAIIIAGVEIAALRAHWVAGPVLKYRYYGPIEGRIRAIDQSASHVPRITLDGVRLAKMPLSALPSRVRVALHGDRAGLVLRPGDRVMLTGHLSPPPGPAEPGGFDFQRHAWFLQLGGVGYTRSPVVLWEPTAGVETWLGRFRQNLSLSILDQMPSDTGPVAVALTTGDRTHLNLELLLDLRRSNLAHLLAISGLHMGLLTGLIFAILRLGLAMSPYIAMHWPVKKLAAFGAILSGLAYLLLSGASIATERAFLMALVLLCAVIFDRRAVTLRAVAIAAMIILILWPEAMMGPGFQMSFAATIGLVWFFRLGQGLFSQMPKWVQGPVTLALSSLIAGLATAPIAAAHFNQLAHYGVIANFLSIPVMAFVIMPGAIMAVLLAPLGIAWCGLLIMHYGISWIIAVAKTVAGWDGAFRMIASPHAASLPLIVLGALVVILIRQLPLRLCGVPVILLGFGLWHMQMRPDILVSSSGRLIGVMTEGGRVLNRAKGDGFAARVWLENDGDLNSQETAFTKPHACPETAFALPIHNRHDLPNCIDAGQIDPLSDGAYSGQVQNGRLVWRHSGDAQGDRLWSRR